MSKLIYSNKHLDPNGLTEATMRRNAPSIFASESGPRMTDKYLFVPTWTVVQALMSQGWTVSACGESRTGIEENKGFTKHIIRMRHPSIRLSALGDSLPEIVLINAHNGGSAYKLMAGVFRLVCMNGLVVKTNTFDEISYRHTAKVATEIVEGSARVINSIPQLSTSINTMRDITLNADEKQAFAEAAAMIRFGDQEERVNKIRPDSLLTPRRREDRSNDLWTVFNVTQENAINGTHYATTETGRRATIQPVKGIDGLKNINQGLWMLAEKMAELKLGK